MSTPITTKPRSTPPGWRWVQLTEVAKLESGHTPSRRNPEYWGGDIPWLSLKDIQGLSGLYIFDTVDKPTMLGIDNSSARLLPAGTVALCRTASVGKVAILGRQMATSQDFVNWVCGPNLNNEYLYWAFHCSSASFDVEKQGSTHKTIYMPTLERLNVLLPPLNIQCRISQLISRADAIRRKRQESIALTEQLLRSTFLEMFGDPVTNPKRWPKKFLGEISTVSGGLQVTEKRKALPLEAPYLRVANVLRDRLDLREIKNLRITAGEFERAQLRKGDLLVVEGHGNPDEIGRAAVWDGSVTPCVHQNHLIRVRVDGAHVTSAYLNAFLNSSAGRLHMDRVGKTTSGLNTISTENVRSLEVLLPPLEEQKKFDEATLSIRNLLNAGNQSLAQSEVLFKSLVQRAFTGQL